MEDGRGGSITASLPITVRSSHHPPVLGGRPGKVEVAQQVLGIPAPVSPDGDPLTVTINALPRGTVRNGTAILHPGDHVTPEELSKLTFWPEAGFTGPAGSLRYTVDNGHGGIVEGSIDVEVGAAAANDASGRRRRCGRVCAAAADPRDFTAFLRLFPDVALMPTRRSAGARNSRSAANAPAASRSAAAAAQPAAASERRSASHRRRSQRTSQRWSPRCSRRSRRRTRRTRPPPPVMTAANGPLIPVPSTAPRGKASDANRFQDCPDLSPDGPHPGRQLHDGTGVA